MAINLVTEIIYSVEAEEVKIVSNLCWFTRQKFEENAWLCSISLAAKDRMPRQLSSAFMNQLFSSEICNLGIKYCFKLSYYWFKNYENLTSDKRIYNQIFLLNSTI